MSKQTEAMKTALTALKSIDEAMPFPVAKFAIRQLKEALAEQPAQHRHISYVCPQCYWSLDEQPAQQQEPLSRVDVACDIKTLCANGDLPDRFEEVAEWVAAGEMPAQQQEPEPSHSDTQLAEQCVCGEPDTPGTHRTDGPCLAEQPAQGETK